MTFALPDTTCLPDYSVVIGESFERASSGGSCAHIYPANGEVTSTLALASASDVDAAVASSQAAFPAWRDLPGNARRNLLLKLADLIERDAVLFGQLATLENGSPSMMGPYMGPVAAERFRYYAGYTDKIKGETLSAWNGPAHNYVNYEPFGVVAAIIPWNGPLFAAAMVMAPALAAGNCVILKAPELAPYAALHLGKLCVEAGLPPGVVNTLLGGPEVGEAMVAHPGVGKVQFVGSGATARKVLKTASETLKPVALELGGKSAVVVFDDADLMAAAQRGLSGAMSVSGQGCVNGTRLLVSRAIYPQYLEMLKGIAGHIPVGDPLAQTTVMGPLISEASVARILGVIDAAQADGATLALGGERLQGDYAAGYYLPITLLADVDNASAAAQREIFGPVLTVTPFDSEEEAIALANGTDYGLGAYVHTQDLRRAHRVANAMQAGMVQVNASGEGMQPFAPFGGMKHSGFGRLGGEQGLLEFLQPRNVWMNLAEEAQS
jgi:acyl-CoA reductase-like NAD-dependent aldehyde dehydrogenase